MSNIELSSQQQTQLAKLEKDAGEGMSSSYALPLLLGGVAFLLLNPIGLPVAILAASPFLWNVLRNAHRNGLNAEYHARTGLFAHTLNGDQLIRLTRLLGKDAVVNQLLAAHEDDQPFSGDALDYLEAVGYKLEPEQDLKTFLANPVDRPQLPAADRTVEVEAHTVLSASAPATIEPGKDWIRDLLFDSEGNLRRQHISLNGKTQSGKSTLASHLMSCIAGNQKPKIWLVNPKHIGSSPDWEGITPYCTSIDDYLAALRYFNSLLQGRCKDDFSYQAADPWFFVLEELDWAVDHHGKKAVLSLLMPLIKVGAALKITVILVGQSAQAEYLNGSAWRQFSRIIIGSEALAFLQNPQFAYSHEVKQPLKELAEQLTEKRERFALVIPFEGLPSIQVIPDLSKVPVPLLTGQVATYDSAPIAPHPEGIQKTTIVDNIRYRLEWLVKQDDVPVEPAKQVPGEITYPMMAIVEYCKRKGKPLTARDIQRASLKELNGLNSDEIKSLLLSLQDLGKGKLEGDKFYLV